MSKLTPPDDGKRPSRLGLSITVGIVLVLVGAAIVIEKAWTPSPPNPSETSSDPVKEEVEELRKPPKPPSIHPLEGEHRLFLADGCRHRYRELTFTRYFSEQHDHPGVILRDGDPTLWRFVGVPEKPEVYRIFCADPNFPEFHAHNLTYTRLVDDGVPLDDRPPYLTLRGDDSCEWQVQKLEARDQYRLYCLSGSDPFQGESLGWMAEQEDLQSEWVTATLGVNGNPPWWILPPNRTPELPRRTTHLIIMNKGDIPDLAESREDFAEEGHGIFQVRISTDDDEFIRSAEEADFVQLVKNLRNSDPVIGHPDFPSLSSLFGEGLESLLSGDSSPDRSDSLFPLVIPLKVALRPHLIRELTVENVEFWRNEWESVEEFQGHLDESDAADGRIYHSDYFTFIFVSWDP
jgi:hypothetical protein